MRVILYFRLQETVSQLKQMQVMVDQTKQSLEDEKIAHEDSRKWAMQLQEKLNISEV